MKCKIIIQSHEVFPGRKHKQRVRDKPNKIKIFVYEAVKVCKSEDFNKHDQVFFEAFFC